MRRTVKTLSIELRSLLCDWDPLGVMGEPSSPRDEYDCLLSPLLRRVLDGESDEALIDYLSVELEDHFGVDAASHEIPAFVQRVRTWHKSLNPGC
ncbi:MAG: hypothetical protein WC655_29075 [Candidatus Hydrogenedentales bacterium]